MPTKFVYRASHITPCPKQLSAIRLGIEGEPDPPHLTRAAEEGNLHEKAVKDSLRAEGIEVIEGGLCQRCLDEFGDRRFGIHIELNDTLPFRIVGHTDGRVKDPIYLKGLEVKSRGFFEFQRWMKGGFDGFPEAANQLAVYWSVEKHREWMYVTKDRSSGYIDKRILTSPPVDISEVLSHVFQVEDWVKKHNTPMEAEYEPRSLVCKWCRYQKVLGCVKEAPAIGAETKELDAAVAAWLSANERIKAAESDLDTARETIGRYAKGLGYSGRTWRYHGVDILNHTVSRESYSKKKLLEIFTEEQIAPAKSVSSYEETRIIKSRGKGEEP